MEVGGWWLVVGIHPPPYRLIFHPAASCWCNTKYPADPLFQCKRSRLILTAPRSPALSHSASREQASNTQPHTLTHTMRAEGGRPVSSTQPSSTLTCERRAGLPLYITLTIPEGLAALAKSKVNRPRTKSALTCWTTVRQSADAPVPERPDIGEDSSGNDFRSDRWGGLLCRSCSAAIKTVSRATNNTTPPLLNFEMLRSSAIVCQATINMIIIGIII